MAFTLLPAVDVSDGRAVRLVQGDAGRVTTHGSARDAALGWQADGATWIHLVDLDAAFGRGANTELLTALIGELDVEVQLSGGVHDDVSLERALSSGCARINLSTAALADPAWCARVIAAHGERVAVGLDVRAVEAADGSTRYRLAARGDDRSLGDDRHRGDSRDLWATLAQLDLDGCARYVVTDVGRDGTLAGPNVALCGAVARATTNPVIASGGIGALDDLLALAAGSAGANLEGAIVGQAIYAGRFTLPEALAALRRLDPPTSTRGRHPPP